MRKLLKWLLQKPVTWLANRVSSSPGKEDVFASLSALLKAIEDGKPGAGVILSYNMNDSRFVVVSDQHKGTRDNADDFRTAEKNYLAAMRHYYKEGFTLLNIGDCEELWENAPKPMIEKNRDVLGEEARFLQADRYYRTFGNHDLEWKYEFQRNLFLKPIFGDKLKIVEGILLRMEGDKDNCIFLTHGHQGDKKSDGNPFSTWVVAAIWTPIQRFLDISVNTTSDSFELVDKHNIIMYEWSTTKKNLVFISGHTHKPVFASLDHIDRLTKELETAKESGDAEKIGKLEAELAKRAAEYTGKQVPKSMAVPSYFNSGCCCFSDGDITVIELEADTIRLVKWRETAGNPERLVLEESSLSYIFSRLS